MKRYTPFIVSAIFLSLILTSSIIYNHYIDEKNQQEEKSFLEGSHTHEGYFNGLTNQPDGYFILNMTHQTENNTIPYILMLRCRQPMNFTLGYYYQLWIDEDGWLLKLNESPDYRTEAFPSQFIVEVEE